MTQFAFDDRNVTWNKLGDFEHFEYSVLDVNEERGIVDVLFRFDSNAQIVLHRHKALNKSFVVQGEHRLYEPDGRLKEVRSVGTYTSSPADPNPHREGGGDEGAVVFFSIRGEDDLLYEVLDDDQNIVATLGVKDFAQLHAQGGG